MYYNLVKYIIINLEHQTSYSHYSEYKKQEITLSHLINVWNGINLQMSPVFNANKVYFMMENRVQTIWE